MRNLLVLGISALVCACGGVISDAPDGGDSGTVVPPTKPGEPPPPPQNGTPPSNETRTFAIKTIFLGETDRNGGAPSNVAWKSFGYDLDGLVTTKDSTDVCALASGAPKSEQVDGNQGIDNAWGSTLLPILQTTASLPMPSATMTKTIQSGAMTLEIQIVGLTGDASQSSTGLEAQVFLAGVYPGTPAFDSTTDWPVLASSLADGQTLASGSKTTYQSAYVSNGTFVSGGSSGLVTLDVMFGGTVGLPIVIHDSLITIDPAGNGTLAGVIDPKEFNATLQTIAGTISTSLCGAAFDGIAQQNLMAQDILIDGPNVPGQSCNGVSIGIGFTAVRIANPTKVQGDPTPLPNPCL